MRGLGGGKKKNSRVYNVFYDNPRYWTKNPRIRQKAAFFEVRCHFGPFSHKPKNQFFAEYSTGVEISTVKFSEKKLMMFVDIHNKYLELTLITYENTQKVNRIIFFQPHSSRQRETRFQSFF